MHILLLLLVLLAIFGHAVLAVALINRAHATPISTRVGKLVWLSMFVLVPSVPLFFAYWFRVRALHLGKGAGFFSIPPAALPYLATCWLAALAAAGDWLFRKFRPPPDSLRSDRRRVFRLLRHPAPARGEDHQHHFLVHLPGNQTLDLEVVERTLSLPGLPAALDRFRLLHLSDLHLTGLVGKGYFQEVVRICNDLEPHLVALTGDLVDNETCIPWLPEILGPLRSRHGCYFILGNHDVHAGPQTLRDTLERAGLIDVGSRWLEVPVGEERIVLAGNELPWFPPAADFGAAPPPSSEGGPVRIVLSHSPDQFLWAQRNGVDLMLAGHLHGGQIRLPVIGPIVSPSRHGVRYAAGVFQADSTVMHVSRGVSGEIPLRWNCSPEVGLLTLRASSPDTGG